MGKVRCIYLDIVDEIYYHLSLRVTDILIFRINVVYILK